MEPKEEGGHVEEEVKARAMERVEAGAAGGSISPIFKSEEFKNIIPYSLRNLSPSTDD